MQRSILAESKTQATNQTEKISATLLQQLPNVSKSFTKTEILADISEALNIPRKKVDQVLLRLQSIIEAHVKQSVPFSLPGLLKVYLVDKPATPERNGTNPFTGEPTTFKAKPAHKAVKVKPLKKLKELV